MHEEQYIVRKFIESFMLLFLMARAKSGRIGLDTYYLTALYRRINGNVESTYGKSYRKKINRAVLLTSSLIGFDELEQTPKLQGERGELYC